MDSLKEKEKKEFSIIARIKSANHAWRGLYIFFVVRHDSWVHLFFALLAVYLGFVLNISSTEWLILVLTLGIVIAAEAFNTAIEIDIDLTSPQYHPYAKDTKDVAAGAVGITAIMACIVGLIIFLPKIIDLLK
jgi:diacylglycerol kinase